MQGRLEISSVEYHQQGKLVVAINHTLELQAMDQLQLHLPVVNMEVLEVTILTRWAISKANLIMPMTPILKSKAFQLSLMMIIKRNIIITIMKKRNLRRKSIRSIKRRMTQMIQKRTHLKKVTLIQKLKKSKRRKLQRKRRKKKPLLN